MEPTALKKPRRPEGQARWARRQEEILETAGRLFAEHGYSKTDTQLLAEKLHVGKGTLYRYFSSKEELFLATVDRAMRQLRQSIDEFIAEVADPLDRVIKGIRAFLAFLAEHPEFVELIMQERAQFKDRKKPTYFEHREVNVVRWHALYRDLIAQGRIRPMPVERISDVLGDLLYGTMFTNHFAGPRKSFEDQARDIIDIVFHGILSEAERRRHEAEADPVAR